MRSAMKALSLAAAAVGALCVASSASAQAYGYGRSYAPPPPPPPAPGQVFERDDRYVEGASITIPNSDGSFGYQNYTSRPDATPDDPDGYAYRAERERRGGYGYGRYDDGYSQPSPRYSGRGYAPQGYGSDDGYGYSEPRRARAPRYDDRFDDDAPSPRYAQPSYGGYPSYSPNRGW